MLLLPNILLSIRVCAVVILAILICTATMARRFLCRFRHRARIRILHRRRALRRGSGRGLLRLRQGLNAAEAALQSQQLQLETCGSIAEASLKLNGVFEAAQKAAEQYQQNVERLCQEKISAAESQAQEILARAKKAASQQ